MNARSTMRHGHGHGRAGFTLIEVMVSLGVMMIGAMAIISLQQETIRGNMHARQVETATQIGQLWIERLKQDAHSWTQVGVFNQAPLPDAAAVLAQTNYLGAIIGAPGVFQGLPFNAAPLSSPAFDYDGVEVNPLTAAHTYCVSFRPTWVWYGRAMKVDVRVWWARAGTGEDITNQPLVAACADNNQALSPGGALFNNYHVIYLPTVIRATPLYH